MSDDIIAQAQLLQAAQLADGWRKGRDIVVVQIQENELLQSS